MDLPHTLRQLRMEKKWYDEVISSLEQLQGSKPVRAAALLDLRLRQVGPLDRRAINARSRLSKWLRQYKIENLNGGAARRRESD